MIDQLLGELLVVSTIVIVYAPSVSKPWRTLALEKLASALGIKLTTTCSDLSLRKYSSRLYCGLHYYT